MNQKNMFGKESWGCWTVVRNGRLDKREFIAMGVLSHNRGFNVLARITYMVEMPPSSLEKTMENIHKVKMAELPWQYIEGGFKRLRELEQILEQMLCKT